MVAAAWVSEILRPSAVMMHSTGGLEEAGGSESGEPLFSGSSGSRRKDLSVIQFEYRGSVALIGGFLSLDTGSS